ncbi:hypothetical protein SADUNF_Sadunf08G0083000 [Salix dunnii]|uniref:Uncharacterized protein n=1 Tax=Salix dunnii TaxID=1413687 RepID=A0A835JXH6_9ROSI|nr:hypothetical protein SADUNF_Sadunf08G0083000 [Salix dunnii]
MKAYQTPSKKEHYSRASSDRICKDPLLKKPLKNAKKSLNGSLISDTQGVSPEINKEPSGLSPVSEISDADHCSQTEPISMLALNPIVSASTEIPSLLPDITPNPNIISTIDDSGSISTDSYGLNKQRSSKIGQVEGLEADIVVNLLKQARIEVSKADVQSKKLLDALMKVVIDEFYTLTEEKDLTNCFVSMKGLVLCLCLLIWSFAVSMFLLFDLRLGSSAGGPLRSGHPVHINSKPLPLIIARSSVMLKITSLGTALFRPRANISI